MFWHIMPYHVTQDLVQEVRFRLQACSAHRLKCNLGVREAIAELEIVFHIPHTVSSTVLTTLRLTLPQLRVAIVADSIIPV